MNKCQGIHQIAQLRTRLESAERLIVNLPELRRIRQVNCYAGDLTASAPHDYGLMKEHRKQLEDAGWQHTEEYRHTDDGTLAQHYRQDMVTLRIYYRPEMEGSTCQVRKIGEEMRPIVEVTCGEA